MKRRLIGETFPVKKISEESAREKSIRHGHISTLHLWWARRPLASSRATIYASLIDLPQDVVKRGMKNDQIAEMSKWENSLNHAMVAKIRQEILDNNNGKRPRVLDPFGGGGAIPLEALRLGCETYSGDVNPVAIIIQKCILEYPQRFGRSASKDGIAQKDNNGKLLSDIKKWSDWVLEEAHKEIGKFYTEKGKDNTSVGYITARTVKCQNPKCGVEIPLVAKYQFVNNKGKKIAVHPHVKGKKIEFKIIGDGYEEIPKGFELTKGTISGGRAICIACNTVIDPNTLKSLFWKNESYDKQIVAIVRKEGSPGKTYRPINNDDMTRFTSTAKYMKIKRETLFEKFILDPIPDEIIPTPENAEHVQGGSYWRDTKPPIYGMTKWRDLFNSRQMLAMIVFLEKIRMAHQQMLDEKYDKEYAKVISTYLAIMLDRLADKISNLVVYNSKRETIEHVFGRQALQMTWDYVELNPFTNNGWHNMQDWVLRVVEHCSNLQLSAAQILHESATSLSYKDEYFDAIFTDPPYYDNIPYSTISDFFYVWLKRSVGHLHPELFATPLTPKSEEAVATLPLACNIDKKIAAKTIHSLKTKEDYELILSKSFGEMYRVLKEEGVAVIVYAHKSTDGWETLINAILESGLVITAAWPLHTERKARMVAQGTAALSSSIYMVARKIKKEELGFYRDIKKEMSKHINTKLKHMWDEGISGADFFISAIGISLEIFGKYDKIIDDADKSITTPHLLDDIRKMVTDFVIGRVLEGNIGNSISHMTRFYILWRQTYGHAKVPFDDALKMAQSVGIDIDQYDKGLIHKDGSFIRILGPSDRDIDRMDTTEWIDILHKLVLLWKSNKRSQMQEDLKKAGLGASEQFYKVAQAISNSVPETDEAKLLDGFLSAKNKIMSDAQIPTKDNAQTKLFD